MPTLAGRYTNTVKPSGLRADWQAGLSLKRLVAKLRASGSWLFIPLYIFSSSVSLFPFSESFSGSRNSVTGGTWLSQLERFVNSPERNGSDV